MITRRAFLGVAAAAVSVIPFAPAIAFDTALPIYTGSRDYEFFIYGNYEPFRNKLPSGKTFIRSDYILGDKVKLGDPNVWKELPPIRGLARFSGRNFSQDEHGVQRHIIGTKITMSVSVEERDAMLSASCTGEEYKRSLLKVITCGAYHDQIVENTYLDTRVLCKEM